MRIIQNPEICETQSQIIEAAAKYKPQVVLIKNWTEPDDFVYVVQRMHEVNSEGKIIIFVSNIHNQKDFISICESKPDAVIQAGANLVEIDNALSSIIAGETYISSRIAKLLLSSVIDLITHIKSRAEVFGFEQLSKRETEVYALMRKGRKNREMAEHLNISVNTIQNHIVNINKKLSIRDRRAVVNHLRDEDEDNCFAKTSQLINHLGLDEMSVSPRTWIFNKQVTGGK